MDKVKALNSALLESNAMQERDLQKTLNNYKKEFYEKSMIKIGNKW